MEYIALLTISTESLQDWLQTEVDLRESSVKLLGGHFLSIETVDDQVHSISVAPMLGQLPDDAGELTGITYREDVQAFRFAFTGSKQTSILKLKKADMVVEPFAKVTIVNGSPKVVMRP
jgi:hypothetical protein